MDIVIFSGTTEGRKISEYLSESGIHHDVCVATKSGEYVMEESDFACINVGRLDKDEISAFLTKKSPKLVIDATHPYAELVTDNVRSACKKLGIEYLRLQRDSGTLLGIKEASQVCARDKGSLLATKEESLMYDSAEEVAMALAEEAGKQGTQFGNILLTTGSKEAGKFTHYKELKDRIYIRVLPSLEAIDICRKLEINEKNIIAMYGPHTEEMNVALINQFNIKHLVTKESGTTGGFPEKVSAAEKTGIKLHVIKRPANSAGISFEECIKRIKDVLLTEETYSNKNNSLIVKLIGIGPGNPELLSVKAINAVKNSDYIFGAERMIESLEKSEIISSSSIRIPEYLPDAIISKLEDIFGNVSVLFSGDTGIYSGAKKLYKALLDFGKCESVEVIPGISSFAYFASATGEDYQDAHLESIHGKSDENTFSRIRGFIKNKEKTYILMSGKSDIDRLKKLIADDFDGKIILGVNLSYADQKIIYTSLHNIDEDLTDIGEGLYIAMVCP